MTTSEGFSSSVANLSGDLRRIELNVTTNRQSMDLDSVFTLQKSEHYSKIMQKVEENGLESGDEQLILDWKKLDIRANNEKLMRDWQIFYEKYEQLILECYALLVEVENEVASIHNFVQDKYKVKVGALESLVDDPTEYARFVKRIGRELDLTTLVDDLGEVLPSTIVEVFCCWQIEKTLDACDTAVALVSAKKKLYDYLERRTGVIAPNLCALVGSGVAAAKIMSTAGGLKSLAKMPRCGVIGAIAWEYFEQSSHISQLENRTIHMGYLDACGYYPTGEFGACTRRSICKLIVQWRKHDAEHQKYQRALQPKRRNCEKPQPKPISHLQNVMTTRQGLSDIA